MFSHVMIGTNDPTDDPPGVHSVTQPLDGPPSDSPMNEAPPRRARSMAEWAEIRARMGSDEDRTASIRSFRPRPGDVVIGPYGKCGTTWLQQTFHTLRTRGDMDFDDISRVVPWIETARMLGIDLDAPQRAAPRGFKSHLPYDELPRGARCVVSLRDPKDALVSMYRFMEGWFLEPGAIPIAEFAQPWLDAGEAGGGYWQHLLSWWAQRDNPDVLLLSYEHMCADPAGSVRRLARFCGIALDDELLALTLERSSLAFMLKHKDRFDDAMVRAVSEQRGRLPRGSDSAKVRRGGSGAHRHELPEAVGQALDAIWHRTVAAKTGFTGYASLEAALRQRLAAA